MGRLHCLRKAEKPQNKSLNKGPTVITAILYLHWNFIYVHQNKIKKSWTFFMLANHSVWGVSRDEETKLRGKKKKSHQLAFYGINIAYFTMILVFLRALTTSFSSFSENTGGEYACAHIFWFFFFFLYFVFVKKIATRVHFPSLTLILWPTFGMSVNKIPLKSVSFPSYNATKHGTVGVGGVKYLRTALLNKTQCGTPQYNAFHPW